MKWAAFVVVSFFVFLLLLAVIVPRDDTKAEIKKELTGFSMLAERINAACKPGYKPVDWTVGDELDPGVKGIVRVTCLSQVDDAYKSYTVAVPR